MSVCHVSLSCVLIRVYSDFCCRHSNDRKHYSDGKEMDRLTDRKVERPLDNRADLQTNRLTDKHADRYESIHTQRQMDGEKLTDRGTDKKLIIDLPTYR